jgi:PAS domain S-box-containing protein
MRKIITSFIVILFISLGIFNIYKKVTYKESYDGIIWEYAKGSLKVQKVIKENNFFPPLKKGDTLLEIDNIPINSPLDYQQALANKKLGEKSIYYLARGKNLLYSQGEIIVKRIPMVYFYLLLIGFATLFIGYYILFLPSSLTAYSQNLFFLVSLSFYSVYVFSPTSSFDFWDQIFFWIDKISFLLFPPILFHFFLTFPTEYKKFNKIRDFFYIFSGFLTVLYIIIYTQTLEKLSGLDQTFIQNLFSKISLGYFSIVFLLTLAFIWKRYKESDTVYNKNQLKWIFWGINAGFVPFFLFYVLPFFSNPAPPEWAQFIVLFQLVIPLTFAYAISGYKLMDFEIIAKKYFVYVLGFVIVFTFYVFIIINFAPDFQGGITIGAAAILLGVLVLNPLYTFLEELSNKLFYRRSYFERENLISFSKIVTYEKNLKVLSSRFLEILTSALLLKQAALYLFEEKSGDFILLNSITQEQSSLPGRLFFSEHFFEKMRTNDFLWFYSINETRWLERPDKTKLNNIEGFHILPLVSQKKIIGFLSMSKKIDGSYLTTEDWSLLLAISPSISLAIENASLYSSLENRIEEIRSLKDFSDNILENVKVGIFVIDGKKRIKHWNRYMEELLGLKRENVIGEKLESIFGNETGEKIIKQNLNESFFRFNFKDINKNRRNLEVSVFNLDKNGDEKIILLSDITEKLNLERELITREKLASLGLLSAGIVHEINTPLTGISSYSQILESTAKTKKQKEIATKIREQSERMRNLIRSLLNFSREGQGLKVPFNLYEAIDELKIILEHKIKQKRIKFLIDGKNLLIKGDRVKIQQAIINLVINAIDASSEGEEVRIRIYKNDKFVNLEIMDRGRGIDKDDIPFIFDPFFTTKEAGKGTGLGLSITYNIIKEHNGDIFVHSKPNVGTKFTIVFPVHEIKEESDNDI